MSEKVSEQSEGITTSITGLTCKPLAILSETISPEEMSRVRGGIDDIGNSPPIEEPDTVPPCPDPCPTPPCPDPCPVDFPEPDLNPEPEPESLWEEITETAEEIWDEATEFVEDVWDWLTDDEEEEEEEEEEEIDEEETEEETEEEEVYWDP